ncbi:MAG: alcohol dehydrogenase [Rhodospirillales bacterium]|nr:alcohol dehydrogenase [Rhodospirillales bacterium]
MRAWQVNGQGEPSEVMREVEMELAPAGSGELVIQVTASALALPDVLLCRGVYPLTPPLPFTPGLEFVGTVIEAGPGTSTPVGARLMGVAAFTMGTGAFADRCKTYEPMVYSVGSGMDDADAAGFTIAYHTAYVGLVRRGKLRAGETVLVHGGAGGTGFAAIQLAKALGARVIATAGGPEKAALCRELGADTAIDHMAGDFVQAVNDATGGRGADIVFDPVGGEMFEKSADCTAPEGRLLPIGFACGRWGMISPLVLTLKNISIVGVLAGGFPREDMVAMHEHLLRLYGTGAIRMKIDRKIGFGDIRDGVQDVADRKVHGRIVAIH